jgi:hypothetical protein
MEDENTSYETQEARSVSETGGRVRVGMKASRRHTNEGADLQENFEI